MTRPETNKRAAALFTEAYEARWPRPEGVEPSAYYLEALLRLREPEVAELFVAARVQAIRELEP